MTKQMPAELESDAMLALRAFGAHRFAVFDPMRDEPALQGLASCQAAYSLAPAGLQSHKAQLPSLIEYGGRGNDLRSDLTTQSLARIEAGAPSPGWSALLVATDSIDALAKRLAHRCLIRDQQRTTWLARPFDPSVIHQLRWMLTPAQLRTLFAPIERWTYVLAGKWQSFVPGEPSALPDTALPSMTYEVALQCVEPINLTCAALSRAGDPAAWSKGRSIQSHIERARTLYGFTEVRDLANFAAAAEERHPRFDTHAVIADRLRSKTQEDSYEDLLSDLTEEQWAQVALDLKNPKGAAP